MSLDAFDRIAMEQQAWAVAAAVPDPEVPCVTVADLGILRSVALDDNGEVVATLTPTYSACPATTMIEIMVRSALVKAGFRARVETQLSPAWTTDWITEDGHQKLKAYGIAPPEQPPVDPNALFASTRVPCPRCGDTDTEELAAFGSTLCKAQYRCKTCLEPFDYFKCHRQFA